MSKINNFLNIMPFPQKQLFKYDKNANEILLKEIFVKVSLNKWDDFKDLCDLPINWLETFAFEKKYDLKKRYNDTELLDESVYFNNFFSVAIEYFPTEYSLYILEKIVHSFANKQQEKHQFQIELVQEIPKILKNQQNDILEKILQFELITFKDVLAEIFANYSEFKNNAIEILKNKEFLEFLYDNKQFLNKLKMKTLHSNERLEEAISLLEDVKKYAPEITPYITDCYVYSLYYGRNQYNEYTKRLGSMPEKLLKYLLIEQYIELDTPYDRMTESLNRLEKNTTKPKITIKEKFVITNEFIEEIKTEKINKFKDQLDKNLSDNNRVTVRIKV